MLLTLLSDTWQVFLTRASITDEPDLEGRTALMWAASKGADEAIATWVRHNPDLRQTDKNGGTGKSKHSKDPF